MLVVDITKFVHETMKREAKEKQELMKKFEKIFNDYNVVQQKYVQLKTKVQLLEQRQVRAPSSLLFIALVLSTSRSPPISIIDASVHFDSEIDTPITPLVPYVDDELEPTRSTDPTKDQILEKIDELEQKLKELEDRSASKQMEIVNSMLTHLNEKVDSRLNNIHSLYSLLFNAIQSFDKDKEVEIALFTKWLQRGNQPEIMLMASKQHVQRTPTLHPTYLLVKSMQEA